MSFQFSLYDALVGIDVPASFSSPPWSWP